MAIRRDLEDIRRRYEAFCQELERAYYLEGAGHSQEIRAAEIYERYQDLSSLEFVRSLREQNEGGRPAALLLESACQSYLGNLTRRTSDEILNTESAGVIVLAETGERMSFRSSAVALANEPDRERRRAIARQRDRFTDEQLNPLHERAVLETWEGVRALESASYRSLAEEVSDLDLGALQGTTGAFLGETQEMYADVLAWMARKQLGIPARELERHDLAVLSRAAPYDEHFPEAGLVERMLALTATMGLAFDGSGRIRLDVEPRPRKSPRAFCSPVRIPDEVYLVIRPSGGLDDYKAFLHELGHALHFSNTDPALAWEYRRLGDNSVTEAYAMLFDHLLHDPAWLRKAMGVTDPSKIVQHVSFIELMMLRRYSAKLAYELELHSRGSLEGRRELYSELLGSATGARTTGAQYLADVDPFFYCARYLRAWMLQALVAERLKERFDEDWFLNPRAGTFLRTLWIRGQEPSAETLGSSLGETELTMDRLRRTLERAFAS